LNPAHFLGGLYGYQTDRFAILSECCDAKDLVRQKTGILLWYFSTIALVAGFLATLPPWIWIPDFLIMGFGCLVNASRCGRLHCYITGPIFLLAAIYVGLSTMSIVPIRRVFFSLVCFYRNAGVPR
jgi:hypothetical protein